MHTRTRARHKARFNRVALIAYASIGGIFQNPRRAVRAVTVPLHSLETAGANDDRWFEEASPDEVCNANGTRFLTEMRDRHPEWYRAMYGDMEP